MLDISTKKHTVPSTPLRQVAYISISRQCIFPFFVWIRYTQSKGNCLLLEDFKYFSFFSSCEGKKGIRCRICQFISWYLFISHCCKYLPFVSSYILFLSVSVVCNALNLKRAMIPVIMTIFHFFGPFDCFTILLFLNLVY